MNIKMLFVLILMLAVALFSVQNAEVITVRFLIWHFALSQALVILLAAFCGALAGLVIGTLSRMRRSAEPKVANASPPSASPE